MAKTINGYKIKYDPIYKDYLLINKNNEIVSKHFTYGLALKEANKNKPQKDFNKTFAKSMSLCQSNIKNNEQKQNIKSKKKFLLNKINKKEMKKEENINENKIKKLLEKFKE